MHLCRVFLNQRYWRKQNESLKTLKMLRLNLLVVLTLLCFPFSGIAKESADSLFVKGNKEYAQKNYEAAANAYQKVLDAGMKTSSVYYNLGNTHYRLNSLASAILNY
ncbi:MAG: tetratricopeptide repeat protein, partial [Pedobacter sp.]